MVTDTTIHARALLVSLSISTWSARRYDRAVTDKVNRDYAATRDAGRYNKYLLPGDAPTYKALTQLANSIRTAHYAQTLPWSDENWRLLPTAQYMEYADWYRRQSSAMDAAVRDFASEYPILRDRARVALNSMYRDDDYPSVSELTSRFRINVEYSPVPAAGDIRVDLASDQIAGIERSITSRVETATRTAMLDAWQRLHDCVAHVAERLGTPDAIFRDSLIGNVRETCDLLSRLNVTADPELERFRADVARQLSHLDPDELRDQPSHRAAVASRADAILSAMKDAIGVAA